MASHQAGQVIASLDQLEDRATAEEKLAILALKAEALLQAGFPIESVQLRINLDTEYGKTRPEKQQNNDLLLWGSLMQVQPELISGHITEIPDTFSGWLELAHLVYSYPFDNAALNRELDNWSLRNPDHPANRVVVERIRQKQIATSNHPQQIALLLPLTGKLSAVGKAIRDGFMSAYLESRRIFNTQIKIDIYDTQGNADATSLAVQHANDTGAKFIIGPLAKEAVSAAIAANLPATIDAPEATPGPQDKPQEKSQVKPPVIIPPANMLTFNRAAETVINEAENPVSVQATDSDIFQFDLAPETEALQVAERASKEGHTRAMVMVPENVWGNRIYEAFTRRYQELGGSIVALDRFKKGAADYSSGIKHELNLDLSNIRHKQLETLLHQDIGFTPRRRQDVDMIFIAATPQEARLIKPQLKFFYADDIPVYATSSIYSGKPNPGRDKDLENIIFCDMPWLLTEKPAPGSLQRAIKSSWPNESAKYMRFYALGADAFMLLPQLQWLQDNSSDWISGGTGRLSVDSEGVIQRQLSWASFKNAVPQVVTYHN